METAVFFVGLLFLHSLVSRRLGRTPITAPMVFTAAGLLAEWVHPRLHLPQLNLEFFLGVAETGLVLLLFADASRTQLRVLGHIRNLPARLLGPGMLLTLALGMVAAKVIFPGLTLAEAGILAAILAPTDAGLGQVIVTSEKIPLAIRQALNVEAGLNDGLSVPFLLFFMALAASPTLGGDARLGGLMMEQLGYGAAIGGLIGLAGGGLLGWAQRSGWMDKSWEQLGLVSLPLMCLIVSEPAGASMFIAAFVAGLTVQVGFPKAGHHSVELTEQWGQVFNLSVFLFFGIMAARAWTAIQLPHLLYAAISLTVVRMLPVAVALRGTRMAPETVLFMGWFGPRGLASIVLGLVYLEHAAPAGSGGTVRLTVIATVILSIFAHGISALPGMEWYARRIRHLPSDAPEKADSNSSSPLPTPSP